MERNPLASLSGFKRFFSPTPLDSGDLCVRGIGIREIMPPCLVDRPHGTGDFLLMLFHDPVVAADRPFPGPAAGPDLMMIWTPGKGQFYGNANQRFCHTWIHCDGTRIRQMLRQSALPLLEPFLVPDPSRFLQCLLDVHSELVSYTQPDGRIIGNLLENCMRQLARMKANRETNVRIPENLLAVRRLISTAPARPLTLTDMAGLAGMSVPYFCSAFKKTFGLSPVECLIQHRMHHAAHLLTNWNLTITEIAAQVGYEDLFHFSKMFKKHFGLSPREMRRRKNGLNSPPARPAASPGSPAAREENDR